MSKKKKKEIFNAINEWGSTYSLAFVQSHSTLCSLRHELVKQGT